MDRYQIHFSLVSQQATPNITPAIDKDFQPEKIILFTPERYQSNAEGITKVLKQRGIKCELIPITDQWDITSVRQKIQTLLKDYHDQSVALNVTCGSKPLSIAAYEVFREANKPIFYVHPETDHVIWLYPTDGESFDLQDRVKLHEFFSAYGASVSIGNISNSKELKELGDTLLEHHSRYHKAFPTLNWLAASATHTLRSEPIPTKGSPSGLDDLIEQFVNAKLIEVSNGRLHFADQEDREIVNGLWLDQHIQRMVQSSKVKLEIQDVAANIELTRNTDRNNTVPNELDVAFLHNNRLFVIECKTLRFNEQRTNDYNNMFYKLDSLKKRFGGKTAAAMLVSYLDVTPKAKQRASDLGIEICSGTSVANFTTHLSNWIKSEFPTG